MKPACDEQCPLLLALQSTQPRHVEDALVFYKQDISPMAVACTTSPIIDKGVIRGVVITFREAAARQNGMAELRAALDQKEEELRRIRGTLEDVKRKPPPPSKSDRWLPRIRQLL